MTNLSDLADIAPIQVWDSAQAGPGGAVVIDVFSPIRADWDALPPLDLTDPRWPER